MIIAFTTLGILAYIGALVCTIKNKDWKPRTFLSLYSDMFFLTASIIAGSKTFIIVFSLFTIYSVVKVIAYSKAEIRPQKGKSDEPTK